MSDSPRVLLHDLTRYLEQQQRQGLSVLWCDETLDRALPLVLSQTSKTGSPASPAAHDPDQDLAEVRQDQPRTALDPRKQARQEHERLFQIACARFVKDALELIARTQAAVAGPSKDSGPARASAPSPATTLEPGHEPQPVQPSMFGPEPEVAVVSPAVMPSAAPSSLPEDRKAALEAVAEEVLACTRCVLNAGRTTAVPGTGNHRAGLVLIGEAPGQEEDRQGLPFVGRSGQLLTDILRAVDLAREDVFICNILKCRPPGNRDPQQEEADACAPYLARQLAAIQPRLILCLGRVAAQRLLKTSAALGVLRRTLHFHEGIPVMATFHPAALLRQPAQKREAWDDIRKVRALYDALSADSS